MADISPDIFTLPARDGFSLAGTALVPDNPQAIVLINSAAAVARRFYGGFAAYLAQRGCVVLTYDYRGIGESRPASLRGFPGRMRDLAILDVAGAIDYATKTWPGLPLTYVGHSFGGQALGLIPNNTAVSRALIVASQAGTWRLIQSPERYRILFMMVGLGPPIARLMGYLPGRLGLGADLPRDVFLEWSRWVASRDYFFDDKTLTEIANFALYRNPLRAIGIDDDPWATPAAIDLLVSGFVNLRAEREQVAPHKVGATHIGHFGFFRSEHRGTLWRDAADWLLQT